MGVDFCCNLELGKNDSGTLLDNDFDIAICFRLALCTRPVMWGGYILRNAEFRARIICGNFDAECSAN